MELLKIRATLWEMYSLGRLGEIKHDLLYDLDTKIALDITTSASQSTIKPYSLFPSAFIEDYLSGNKKPVKMVEARHMPCVTSFEVQELLGEKYAPVRQAMVRLRDAQHVLNDRTQEMRECCLSTNIADQL